MKRLSRINLETAFKKKRRKLIKDLFDCIEIINVSGSLCKDHKCFVNVIATQLRILFCDDKNSLVTKLWKDIAFHPLNHKYFDLKGTYEHDDKDLFDRSKQKISLDDWLKQKLIYNDEYTVDIKKAVRLIADKSGAHVDGRLPVALMLLKGHSNLGINYLINVGTYVTRELLNLIAEDHRKGDISQEG